MTQAWKKTIFKHKSESSAIWFDEQASQNIFIMNTMIAQSLLMLNIQCLNVSLFWNAS